MKPTITSPAKLIFSIVICQLAGILGSLFSAGSVSTWYAALAKPALTPPGWIFGPVWITLYTLMGVALYLIWRQKITTNSARKSKVFSLRVFAVQLILNAIWTPIFFGAHRIDIALVVIIALLTSIVWTMMLFFKQSRAATYLLIPYLLWVSFATYLNYAFWMLN